MRAPRDEPLAELATEQGGPVSHEQLLALGLKHAAIGRRLEARRLHRVYDEVYAVGHVAMTPKGWLMAAVLAGGPGAVASHQSAGWWYGLLEAPPSRHHITTPHHRRRGRIITHRTRLTDDVVTEHEGVPITTVARTILDLADVSSERTIERALDQAEVRRSLHMPDLLDLVARSNGRHGLGRLKRVLERHAPGSTLTRSGLEERALAAIRRADLPRPLVNAPLHGYIADLYWPDHRLVVEIDGDHHSARGRFVSDRRRDVALQLAGLDVLRFAKEDVGQPMVAAIAAHIAGGGASPEARIASTR